MLAALLQRCTRLPIHKVDRIKKSMPIFHGANDVRCKVAESDRRCDAGEKRTRHLCRLSRRRPRLPQAPEPAVVCCHCRSILRAPTRWRARRSAPATRSVPVPEILLLLVAWLSSWHDKVVRQLREHLCLERSLYSSAHACSKGMVPKLGDRSRSQVREATRRMPLILADADFRKWH
jgi:hypothetical protein